VGNEHDHEPVGRQSPQNLEQLLALRLGDTRRRLVENQHPGAQPQQARYLELLTFPDRQCLGQRVRIKRETVPVRGLLECACPLLAIEQHSPRRAEQEVVENRYREKHQWILMEHPYSRLDRVARRLEPYRVAVEQHLSGIGFDETGQNLHQRGLAGSVLTEQPVQLAGLDLQRHPVVCPNGAEVFVNIAQDQTHVPPSLGNVG
jgi:hypothetical protein